MPPPTLNSEEPTIPTSVNFSTTVLDDTQEGPPPCSTSTPISSNALCATL